jgi:hypothetical protein
MPDALVRHLCSCRRAPAASESPGRCAVRKGHLTVKAGLVYLCHVSVLGAAALQSPGRLSTCAAQGREEGGVATAPAQARYQTQRELSADDPGVKVEPVKAMAPCRADTVQGPPRFCPSCLSRAMWLWSCSWQQYEGVYLARLSTPYAYTTALQHHTCPPPRICFCRSARTASTHRCPFCLRPMQVWHAAWLADGGNGPQRPLMHVCGRPCPAHRRTAPGPA